MQTFLPFPNFGECARCLDDKRLWKQVVECKQILEILRQKKIRERTYETYAEKHCINKKDIIPNKIPWEHHPAVLMWEGYEEALVLYMSYMFKEWQERKYPMLHNIVDNSLHLFIIEYPPWLGDERLHKSHRAKLYWKNPEYYRQFFDDYCNGIGMKNQSIQEATKFLDVPEPEYFWPVTKGKDYEKEE